MPSSQAHKLPVSSLRPIEVENDSDRLAKLRGTWRAAAMRQWFHGPRVILASVGILALPVLLGFSDPKGTLHGLGMDLSISLAAPFLTALCMLVGFGGPLGLSRVEDLRTIPGGPSEWVGALFRAARRCSLAAVIFWACSGAILDYSYFAESLLYNLWVLLPAVWGVSNIVAAAKLTVKNPVGSSLAAWGLSLWPGYLVFNQAITPNICGNPLMGAIDFAAVIGYGLQGLIAAFITRAALARLSAAN